MGTSIVATGAAVVWANSPASDAYDSLWATELKLGIGYVAFGGPFRPLGRGPPKRQGRIGLAPEISISRIRLHVTTELPPKTVFVHVGGPPGGHP